MPCDRCKRPGTGPECPCVLVSFEMSPHFGEGWIGTDAYQVQQEFGDAGMLAWLKWHLDRGRVYRVVVSIEETNRPEDKRAAGRI